MGLMKYLEMIVMRKVIGFGSFEVSGNDDDEKRDRESVNL